MGIFRHPKTDIDRVYDRNADLLYRLAFSHLQNTHDAQDALQETFVRYMTSSPSFDDENHERAWLIRVLTNQCRDMLRRKKVRSYVPLDEVNDLCEDSSIEQKEEIADLMNSISRIPDKSKAAIVLHYLEGYSVEETAKILGISLSAAKMRLNRGREALLGLLRKEDRNV